MANPENPVEVGYFNTQGQAYDVVVSGRYAYVTAYQWSLFILDVIDPTNPVEVGHYYAPNSRVSSVAVSGNYAYVADGGGLAVVYLEDPSNQY